MANIACGAKTSVIPYVFARRTFSGKKTIGFYACVVAEAAKPM